MGFAGQVGRAAAAGFNADVASVQTAAAPPTLPSVESAEYGGPSYYAVRRAMERTWVNRRNETFTFVDADTVRRRMSVDFTLVETSALEPGAMTLVPLMLLVKQDLRNLDVRDTAGDALPVLTYRQNGTAAILGLTRVLQKVVKDLPEGHPDRRIDTPSLAQVVYAVPSAPSVTDGLLAEGGSLERQLKHAEPAQRARIEALIRELEHSFLLLTAIPYWPGQRVVHKFSYDAAIGLQPQPSLGAWLYTRSNRVLSSVALAGRVESFDGLAVGLAESYHAEAVPPRDSYIAEAALEVVRAGRPVPDAPISDDNRHKFRPHLRAKPTNRGDSGRLTLVVHAHREQLLLPLALSSVLISVVLGFLPSRAARVDGQVLAAVLLVPFALSTYYIRSQENSYITSMLRGVRGLALLPLVAAVFAVALVALGEAPPEEGRALSDGTLDALRIPFVVATPATALLVIALFVPVIGRIRRWAVRPLQEHARRRRLEAWCAGGASARPWIRGAASLVGIVLVVVLIRAAGPDVSSSLIDFVSNVFRDWWDSASSTASSARLYH